MGLVGFIPEALPSFFPFFYVPHLLTLLTLNLSLHFYLHMSLFYFWPLLSQ